MQLLKKGLCLILHVIVATCAREPSSPACSRYDYEERLLERVLRNELALETTLNEILKTNTKVVDALKQLEDGKAKMESHLAVMEKKQIDMESRLGDFISNASYAINSTLGANVDAMVKTSLEMKENASVTVKQLVNEVNILKDQLKVPTICFFGRITSSTVFTSNQDVFFPTVEVNEGHGYDPVTGKFTASVSGMYLLSVQFCCQPNKYVGLEILIQGKAIQGSMLTDNTGFSTCVTMQATRLVVMGDVINVRTTSTSYVYADSLRHVSFSGALIHV